MSSRLSNRREKGFKFEKFQKKFEYVKGWVNEKQNNPRLGNENLLSFPKHDSLKYWRLKSNVSSHMSIKYVNHYLDHFPICCETNGVSKESTCADNMKL
jgi:hypothetical protein